MLVKCGSQMGRSSPGAPWACLFAVITVVPAVGTKLLWGTATGLNNIPTADVTPAAVLVLQQINNFGTNQPARYTGGFKLGIGEALEIGYDGRIAQAGAGLGITGAGGAPSHGATFQAKVHYPLKGQDLRVGAGVANLSTDFDKAGDPVQYVVASQKVERVSGHLGYMLQEGKNNVFSGFDIQWTSKLTSRVDFNNLNNTDHLLSSVGFIYAVTQQWLVEAWYSMSNTAGVNNTATLKLDYVIRF